MKMQVDKHVKLDAAVSVLLNQEAFMSGIPGNRIINMALIEYVRMAQRKRRYYLQGHGEEFIDKLRDLLPGSVHL